MLGFEQIILHHLQFIFNSHICERWIFSIYHFIKKEPHAWQIFSKKVREGRSQWSSRLCSLSAHPFALRHLSLASRLQTTIPKQWAMEKGTKKSVTLDASVSLSPYQVKLGLSWIGFCENMTHATQATFLRARELLTNYVLRATSSQLCP